jgi:hypothetical protein
MSLGGDVGAGWRWERRITYTCKTWKDCLSDKVAAVMLTFYS